MLAFPRKPCSICGEPLTVHRVVHGYCDAPACRVSMGRRRVVERQAEERAAIQAVADAYRDELLSRQPSLAGLEVLVVPGLDAPVQPMTPERVETLRAHLAEILPTEPAEAAAHSLTQQALSNRQVVDAACATCRGHCCRKGGDSAYLRADTIARVRVNHPELDDAAIVTTYLHAVPQAGVTGSCIFHGEQGCTLPRDFRADICNDYYCPPLTHWLNRPDKTGAVATIVVDEARVIRSSLVTSGA